MMFKLCILLCAVICAHAAPSREEALKTKLSALADQLASKDFTLTYNEHAQSFYEKPTGHDVFVYKQGNNFVAKSVVNTAYGAADVKILYLNGDVYTFTNTSDETHCHKPSFDFDISLPSLVELAKKYIKDECHVSPSALRLETNGRLLQIACKDVLEHHFQFANDEYVPYKYFTFNEGNTMSSVSKMELKYTSDIPSDVFDIPAKCLETATTTVTP